MRIKDRMHLIFKCVLVAVIPLQATTSASTEPYHSLCPGLDVPLTLLWIYHEAAAVQEGAPDTCTLARQGFVESRWDVNALSRAGAIGVAQFLPGTARELGVNPMDPVDAIHGQAEYMAYLVSIWDRHGRTEKEQLAFALACYVWGMGNMFESQRRYGWVRWSEAKHHMPGKVRTYVSSIIGEI